MMLLTENPKDATRKLFELISEFGKAVGYKTNILKSVTFLYTNNKKIKRRDEGTILSTITSKRIKYRGISSSRSNS